MSDAGKAVFLSYASQDAEAAKRICDALRQTGVEVWFDQSELRGGDAWDQSIRKQIKACALFVPIITPNTNTRAEGYFRLEWKLAVDRSHLMADDAPFLFPIVIGDVADATARVPDKFRDVQWTRLRLDETPGELAQRVTRLLSRAQGAESVEHKSEDRGRQTRHRPAWMRFAWAGVGIVFALVYAVRPLLQSTRRAEPKPAAVAPATPAAPVSDARQLTERARAILAQGSLTRAQLEAAGELCDRALQLDTTDAIVWAGAAAVDLEMIHPYGYDRSDERRRRAQERAARAISLGPDLFEVRVVQAMVFAHAVGTPALLAEAEKTFRELISSHPDDRKLVLQLAEVLREQKRFDEAARLFESVGEFEVAGWSHYLAGKLRSALAAVERSLRTKRSVTGLQLKALLQVDADEDLEAAQATMDQLQPSELLAEMPGAIAIKLAMYRRDPDRMLEIARGLAQDYLDSNAFRGPRGFYTGLAHELAGRGRMAGRPRGRRNAVEDGAGRPPAPALVRLAARRLERHGGSRAPLRPQPGEGRPQRRHHGCRQRASLAAPPAERRPAGRQRGDLQGPATELGGSPRGDAVLPTDRLAPRRPAL